MSSLWLLWIAFSPSSAFVCCLLGLINTRHCISKVQPPGCHSCLQVDIHSLRQSFFKISIPTLIGGIPTLKNVRETKTCPRCFLIFVILTLKGKVLPWQPGFITAQGKSGDVSMERGQSPLNSWTTEQQPRSPATNAESQAEPHTCRIRIGTWAIPTGSGCALISEKPARKVFPKCAIYSNRSKSFRWTLRMGLPTWILGYFNCAICTDELISQI